MGILSVLFYVAGVALSLGGVNAIVNYGESDPTAIAGMFLVPLILLVLGFACGKMKKAKVVDNLLDKAKSLTEKKEGVEIIKAEKFKSYSVADELMKWAELKKKGSITEDEYLAAKDKLLKA